MVCQKPPVPLRRSLPVRLRLGCAQRGRSDKRHRFSRAVVHGCNPHRLTPETAPPGQQSQPTRSLLGVTLAIEPALGRRHHVHSDLGRFLYLAMVPARSRKIVGGSGDAEPSPQGAWCWMQRRWPSASVEVLAGGSDRRPSRHVWTRGHLSSASGRNAWSIGIVLLSFSTSHSSFELGRRFRLEQIHVVDHAPVLADHAGAVDCVLDRDRLHLRDRRPAARLCLIRAHRYDRLQVVHGG